jgi:hypothetical protein
LYFDGEKLSSADGSNSLDRQADFFDHAVHEIECISCVPSSVSPQHPLTGAVVNGAVLIQLWPDHAGVQMNSIASDWFCVACEVLVAVQSPHRL